MVYEREVLKEEKYNKKIYLVRHATPEGYDGPRKYIGLVDLPLSPEGREEAAATAKWFSNNISINRIYTSPLARAKGTSQIIADACQFKSEVVIDKSFEEIDAGDWDGLTVSEVRTLYPADFEARGRDLFNWTFPNGESFRQVGERFRQSLLEIVMQNPEENENIVIVTHSGSIGSYLALEGVIPESEVRSVPMPFAGLTILSGNAEGTIKVEEIGIVPNEK